MTSKNKSKSKKPDLVKLLTGFRKEMLSRFNGMDKRFDGVDQFRRDTAIKFEGMDKRFESMEKELTTLTKTVIPMDKEVRTLNKKVEVLSTKVDSHAADIFEWQQKTSVALDAIGSVLDQGRRLEDFDQRLTKVENESVTMQAAIKEIKEI